MIDFSCNELDVEYIIKCGIGLTKSEFDIFMYFLENNKSDFDTNELSTKLKLDKTTIQKAVKKLYEKEIIKRNKKNLKKGGYVFTYSSNSKEKVKVIIKGILKTWFNTVEKKIDYW